MRLFEILILSSSAIIAVLGLMHLLVTFRGPKLRPRDEGLLRMMRSVSPVISQQTTMWKAWIGFNVSHSMGAILFGLVYGFLATNHTTLLLQSSFLALVGVLVLISYAILGWRYWFNIPLIGISLSLFLYVAAYAIVYAT